MSAARRWKSLGLVALVVALSTSAQAKKPSPVLATVKIGKKTAQLVARTPADLTGWVQVPFVLETNHPYDESDKSGIPIRIEGAKRIKFLLSRIETEDNYDYFEVYDSNGALVEHISGDFANHTTPVVEGDYASLAITQDSSGSAWGYKLTDIFVQY